MKEHYNPYKRTLIYLVINIEDAHSFYVDNIARYNIEFLTTNSMFDDLVDAIGRFPDSYEELEGGQLVSIIYEWGLTE